MRFSAPIFSHLECLPRKDDLVNFSSHIDPSDSPAGTGCVEMLAHCPLLREAIDHEVGESSAPSVPCTLLSLLPCFKGAPEESSESLAPEALSGNATSAPFLLRCEKDCLTPSSSASQSRRSNRWEKWILESVGGQNRLLEDLLMAETEEQIFASLAHWFPKEPSFLVLELVTDRLARRARPRRDAGAEHLPRRSLVYEAYRSGVFQPLERSDPAAASFVEANRFPALPDTLCLAAWPIGQPEADPLAIVLLGGRETAPFEDPLCRELLLKVGRWAAIALTRIRKKAELETLCIRDPLTGLLNRYGLSVAFETFVGHLRRQRFEGLLGILDLDDFKPVNDTWGHPAGDALLEDVAMRLRKTFRGSDLLGRLGGDEFVFVAESPNRGSFPLLMERISRAFGRPFVLPEGQEMHLGLSAGLHLFSPESPRLEDLLREADTALYTAKRRKGNRDSFFVLCEGPPGGGR